MLSIEFAMDYPWTIVSSLKNPLLTITSPVFSDVIVIFTDKDVPLMGYRQCGLLTSMRFSPYIEAAEARTRSRTFRMLHDLHKVRDFKLVLCAKVWGYFEDCAVRELERIVATEWRKAGGGNPSPEPLVTSRPQGFFPSPGEPRDKGIEHVRWARSWAPNGLDDRRKNDPIGCPGFPRDTRLLPNRNVGISGCPRVM